MGETLLGCSLTVVKASAVILLIHSFVRSYACPCSGCDACLIPGVVFMVQNCQEIRSAKIPHRLFI